MFLETKETRLHLPFKHLPDAVHVLHKAFQRAGKQLYVVGGAVRDLVMKKEPKDFDLATDARPQEVMKILQDHGIKHTKGAVGNQFGVVVASLAGEDYEIATFRKDSGSRQVADEFSDIKDDATRRDLTINALYYDLDTDEVVDHVGGLDDLKSGSVKTVGEADKRFGEDSLRVLRYVRFYCRVNPGDPNKIDPDTRQAIQKRVDNGLQSDNGVAVAPERIRDEFLKGLGSAVSLSGYINLYHQLGLLDKYVFPGLVLSHDYVYNKNSIVVLAHLLRLNDTDKIRRRLNDLKYTNQEVEDIIYLVRLLHLQPEQLKAKLKEQPTFLYNLRKNQRELSPDVLQTWAQLHGLSSDVIAQLRGHELQNRDAVPGADKLKGKEIGQHITKYNTAEILKKFGFKEWLKK